MLGDAACTFNPVYGQGMTTAAIETVLLDTLLARYRKTGDFTGLAPEFQRRLARSNSTPWMLATGEDLRYSKTGVGQSPWITRAMRGTLTHPTDKSGRHQSAPGISGDDAYAEATDRPVSSPRGHSSAAQSSAEKSAIRQHATILARYNGRGLTAHS